MEMMIDRNACIGCGVCVDTCDYVFEMGADHIAEIQHEPDASHQGCAEAAAKECPTDAILLK